MTPTRRRIRPVTRQRKDDRDEKVTLGSTQDMQSESAGPLRHLGELDDLEIAEGAPDPRGWDVIGANGEKVGKVAELLVDTGAMKVRYLEVELEKDVAEDSTRNRSVNAADVRDRTDIDDEPFRHVLVPIGAAHLDDDEDQVRLDERAANIVGIPGYRPGSLTRDYETGVLGRLGAGSRGRADDLPTGTRRADAGQGDFYDGEHFDDRSFLGRRRTVRNDESYLSRTGTSRARDNVVGRGPLASDAASPPLDARPGGVGDPRL